METETIIATTQGPTPRPAFGIATLSAGLIAALLIPGSRAGINIPIVAIVISVAIFAGRSWDRPRDAAVFGGLSFILFTVPAWRAAEWVVALDMLGATGLAILAVIGVDRFRDTCIRLLEAGLRTFRGPTELVRAFAGDSEHDVPLRSYVRTGILTALLLLVFGSLFASADRVFGFLTDKVLPDLEIDLIGVRIFLFVFVVLATAALAIGGPRYAASGMSGTRRFVDELPLIGVNADGSPSFHLRGREWLVPLVVLDVLFFLFVALQATVLFGDKNLVLRTVGLTYAEYARQGFFQLMAVGILTIGVVGATTWWAERSNPRDARTMKLLLGVLCILTLVILGSALKRLGLYESAFGLTRSRLVAHAVILLLGVIFGIVIGAGIRGEAWATRAICLVVGLSFLGFTLINPDQLIARDAAQRYRDTGKIDTQYVASLSADAISSLSSLPAETRACWLDRRNEFFKDDDSITAWNLARSRARAAVGGLEQATGSCPAYAYD